MLGEIFNIFTKVQKQPLLGRWNISYDKNRLERIVYLANHDHCGPCGIINYDKKTFHNNIVNNEKNAEKEN